MARIVNTVFQGARGLDVDTGRLTFRRVLRDAVGDLNMLSDILFDRTAAAFTHDHGGNVAGIRRGALLGVPLAGGCTFTGSADFSSETLYNNSKSLPLGLLFSPRLVYIPRNERRLRIQYDLSVFQGNQCRVFCVPVGTWSVPGSESSWLTEFEDDEDYNIPSSTVTVTPQTLYLVGVWLPPTSGTLGLPDGTDYAFYFPPTSIAHFNRRRSARPRYKYRGRENASPPVTLTTTVGGAARPTVPLVLPHAVGVADDLAFSAGHIGLINATQNTLDEYITASPAGADESAGLTLVSDATTSGFHDHSQRGAYKPNEPTTGLAVWSESITAVGALGEDAGIDAHNGTSPTSATLTSLQMLPDFKATGGTNLRIDVLAIATAAGTPTCAVEIKSAAGASLWAPAAAAMTQIGTSSMWYITLSATAFSPNALNQVVITVNRGGGAGGVHLIAHSGRFI